MSDRESLNPFERLLLLPAGVLLVFMIAPLVDLLAAASPAGVWAEIATGQNWLVIGRSVLMGAVAAVGATLLGVPLAYLLARHDFWAKRAVEGVVQLPVALPHVIIGLALLSLLGPVGTVGALLERLGVVFLDTPLGTITAMMYVSIPYVVNAARAGFESVPTRLEKTARSLGAGPAAVFWEITLPLARRHILDGVSLTWGRSISELGAIMMLAYHPLTVAVYIWHVYIGPDGHNRVRTVGALALAVYLTVFIGFRVLTLRKAHVRR